MTVSDCRLLLAGRIWESIANCSMWNEQINDTNYQLKDCRIGLEYTKCSLLRANRMLLQKYIKQKKCDTKRRSVTTVSSFELLLMALLWGDERRAINIHWFGRPERLWPGRFERDQKPEGDAARAGMRWERRTASSRVWRRSACSRSSLAVRVRFSTCKWEFWEKQRVRDTDRQRDRDSN